MVTKERKFLTIAEAKRIYLEANDKQEAVDKLCKLPKRQPAPPPPEGGICLREAARKYGVSQATLTRAVKRGDIDIIIRTKNWLYVKEVSLKNFVDNKRLKENESLSNNN